MVQLVAALQAAQHTDGVHLIRLRHLGQRRFRRRTPPVTRRTGAGGRRTASRRHRGAARGFRHPTGARIWPVRGAISSEQSGYCTEWKGQELAMMEDMPLYYSSTSRGKSTRLFIIIVMHLTGLEGKDASPGRCELSRLPPNISVSLTELEQTAVPFLCQGTRTCWKRRSRAASFSMCCRYSSKVVAPTQRRSPRANIGFKILPQESGRDGMFKNNGSPRDFQKTTRPT